MKLHVKSFVCNPYQENTYLLYDDTGVCAIIDPGMSTVAEEKEITSFIESNGLKPELLLNTHCHVDHVLGNKFVYDTYGLIPQFHEGELPLLIEVQNYAPQMGVRYDVSPIPEDFLGSEGTLEFGSHLLEIVFAPGHSPAHVCFYNKAGSFLIGGDVLFKGSIGRTDLPGGNHKQLLDSISKRLYTLPGETVVYPGHGPSTSIAAERLTNPFIRG